MRNVRWKIARNALRNLFLLLCLIGFVGICSFIWNSKAIVLFPSLAGIAGTWYLLYRIEIAWREQRLKGWR